MWNDVARRLMRGVVAVAVLALPLTGVAAARNADNDAGAGSVVASPLDPALRGAPLDPSWPKHVYVITDSVMLGAKQAFIRSLPDWEVTYAGRPALMIRKALPEVRQQRTLGPGAGAAHQTGLTYDAIHLNPRGAELMAQVVKVAMGLGETRPKGATIAATSPEPPPRVSAQTSQAVEQDAPVIVRETRIAASGRASPPIEPSSA